MSDSELEFMASTVSEVMSMHADELFATGPAYHNYQFTVSMDYNLNHVLRKVLCPVKVPRTGEADEPVTLPKMATGQTKDHYTLACELAQKEFQDNVKSTWNKTIATLTDDTTSATNNNSQSKEFEGTMILLLAILFKTETIRLPDADAITGELTVNAILAKGTTVKDDAVTEWLTNSQDKTSFNGATFTVQQFQEIFDSILFQNRYNVYAHDDQWCELTEFKELTVPGNIKPEEEEKHFQRLSPDPTIKESKKYEAYPSDKYDIYQVVPYDYANLDMDDKSKLATYARLKTDTAPELASGITPLSAGTVAQIATSSGLVWVYPVVYSEGLMQIPTDASTLSNLTFDMKPGVYNVGIVGTNQVVEAWYKHQYYQVYLTDPENITMSMYFSSDLININTNTIKSLLPEGWTSDVTSGVSADFKYSKTASMVARANGTRTIVTTDSFQDTIDKYLFDTPLNSSPCFLKSDDSNVYIEYNDTVYIDPSGARYIGDVIDGYEITIGTKLVFVVKKSDDLAEGVVWGKHTSNVGVEEWLPCTRSTFNQSDVYQFPVGSTNTYALKDMIEVRYVEEGNDPVSGYSQGKWREPHSPDPKLGTVHHEDSILGCRIDLQENDAVGIVVDLASDSVGLNKILPMRLMIRQKNPTP